MSGAAFEMAVGIVENAFFGTAVRKTSWMIDVRIVLVNVLYGISNDVLVNSIDSLSKGKKQWQFV